MRDFTSIIAEMELIELLKQQFPRLINALYDPRAFTKNGRINKSSLSRLLGLPAAKVDDLLGEAMIFLESKTT